MTVLPIMPDQLHVSPLRDQVRDLLRKAIIEMRLTPGQRLVERELVEWTGVSRATVREALSQLAAEGLVRTIPQRGVVVAVLSAREATELYEIRALLEGLVGRQFVERASRTQVAALKRAFKGFVRSVDMSVDTWTLLQTKGQFYAVLFDGSGNVTVREVLKGLQARITVLRATSLSQEGRVRATIAELRAIVDAVDAGDADAAEKACELHVRAAGTCALAVLPEP